MTPKEYTFAMKDFQERTSIENTFKMKTTFESMRIQTMYIHSTNPHVKKRFKDVSKFMPFTWDAKVIPQTLEQMKSKVYEIARYFNKKKK
jgi:hypothetical protein